MEDAVSFIMNRLLQHCSDAHIPSTFDFALRFLNPNSLSIVTEQ